MPRVHALKARKAYPDIDVAKGDMYYKWSTRMTVGKSYVSRIHRSKTPPSRSQLTSSAFYQAIYSAFGDTKINEPQDVRDLAETVREIGQEEQSKLDNMPEGLQQGSTGELLQERIDACETSADELDSLADEWETAESDHEELEGEDKENSDYDAEDFISQVGDKEPSC